MKAQVVSCARQEININKERQGLQNAELVSIIRRVLSVTLELLNTFFTDVGTGEEGTGNET